MTDNVSKLPLLLTRPRAASESFWDRLPAATQAVLWPVLSPLIEIVPLGATVDLTGIAGVIFTSGNGVAAAPDGAGLPAFCVGAATTRAAQARGWAALQIGEDANGLVTALLAARPAGDLLHLGGVHTQGDVAGRLSAAGLSVRHLALYDQAAIPLSEDARALFSTDAPVIIPLFSPRTARLLAIELSQAGNPHIVALSQNIASQVGDISGLRVDIAARPTADDMVKKVESCVRRLRAT